jgi:hypothetical protein
MGYEILSTIRRFKFLLFGIAITSFSVVAQAPLDIRVALVIGNSAYVSAPTLTNPSNDAKAITNILKRLGFTVINVNDGTKEQMIAGIAQMQAALKGQQAVGMLYYAGHGVQQNWRNYMVPVDFKVSRDVDIPKQAIDVDTVIEGLKKAGTRMNIIVLDACRDNPFGSQASGKGLAQLEAPLNTYIAFATAPGNVAQDGNEKTGNGLFTEYIIKELQKPAPIEDMFKRVRLQVRKASNGSQIPWDSSSLEMDFAFNDGKRYTFNPDDLIKEAQEARAKEEELKRQLAQAKEQERKIAEQREQERLNLVQIQKIKELEARARAEAESKERELKLQLAQDQEKKVALELARALEKAKKDDAQRLKDIELLKAQNAENLIKLEISKENLDKSQFAIQKDDWERIKTSEDKNNFYAYLQKYPNGFFSAHALFKLEELDKVKIVAQIDVNGVKESLGVFKAKVGDEYVVSRVTNNSLFGGELALLKTRVIKIENGLVYSETNGQETVQTINGGQVKSTNGYGENFSYDPPRLDLPGEPLSVGKKWIGGTVENGAKWRDDEMKVIALENVVVPAGKFKTYKIEMNSKLDSGVKVRLTYWVDVDTGMKVKRIREVFSNRGNNINETFTLVSWKRA